MKSCVLPRMRFRLIACGQGSTQAGKLNWRPDSRSFPDRNPDLKSAGTGARIEAFVVQLEARRIDGLVSGLGNPFVPDRGPRASYGGNMIALHKYGVALWRDA